MQMTPIGPSKKGEIGTCSSPPPPPSSPMPTQSKFIEIVDIQLFLSILQQYQNNLTIENLMPH